MKLTSVADPVIMSYGNTGLAKPVISASVAISSWGVHSGQVWVASCDRKIEKLFVNGVMVPLARYPDTGWLRIDTLIENSDGTNSVIHIAALTGHPNNASGYWDNAQIRWRRWSWWFETRRITSYAASGILTLEGKSIIHINQPSRGWGFYIDNKLEELDAPGEWYYDNSTGKVYLYPPGGTDPNNMLIEGAYLSRGIEFAGGTVNNIWFKHQTLYGLSLSRTSFVSNCRFDGIGSDSGGVALRASWDIADSRIHDNRFEDNLNTGVWWYENSGRLGMSILERDTLINTGTFPGYGGSGTWHAVGILVHLSKNVRVQYNYLDKTGYAGILLGSDSNFVQFNIIKNTMWTLNDGGGVYTNCNKSFIRNNIILDTKGDLESSGPWYPLGHGIWLEFLGDFRESVVENNTIAGSDCYGIYLPNNFSCTIKNNTLFDNAVTQLRLDGEEGNTTPQNNRFTGNICYATSKEQKSLLFRPEYNYGTMQNNYFCNPHTDSVVAGYGTGSNHWTIYDYTLAQWQSLVPWADSSPKTDPFKRPPGISPDNHYGLPRIFINESLTAKDFSLGSTAYKDLDNNDVTGSITVPPFSSKILVQVDSIIGIETIRNINELVILRRSRTALHYRLLKKGTVSLTLYNLAGREVYRLPEKMQTAGTYLIDFNGVPSPAKRLAQGVYTYIFTIAVKGSVFSRIGKIVVIN
jgi:parallel beta-helix repeat protein